MLGKLDRAYVYLFWKLSGWLRSDFDFSEKWGEWKGAFAVGMLEIFLLVAALNFQLIIFGWFDFPDNLIPIIIPLALILSFGNLLIIRRQKAAAYIEEFKQHSHKKSMLGGTVVVFIVSLIVVILISSYSMLYRVYG